jgi:tetratricopeptide (TPR) repeat protein
MKYFVLILCLWLCTTVLIAKDVIDSLSRQLSHHPAADTVKVKLLNQLGYHYWIVNPAQSEILGKQALHLAGSLAFTPGQACANRIIGVSLWARGQYSEALPYLIEALSLYQQLDDKSGIGSMYNNIGLVYYDQGNYQEAKKCFDKGLAIYDFFEDKNKQAGILGNLGNTYMQLKKYSKAESLYTQVLHLKQAEGHKYGIAEALSNLGELNLIREKAAKALPYFLQSLQIRTSIEDHEGAAMCHYFIGKAYLHQKKYGVSRQYLQNGISKAQEVKSLKWLTHMYQTLKEVEVATGNVTQAIAYFEKYVSYKDSLFNSEKSRQIAEIQTRFETVEKEQKLQTQARQLALLQEKARFDTLWKNSFLMGLLAMAVITYLIISRQRLKIRRNKELLSKNAEIFRTEQALAQARLENARLQEMKLMEELETTHKQLTSYSLNFIRKNELMEELKESIDEIKKNKGRDNLKELNGLNRLVENNTQIDKDWEDFRRNFEQVHKDFFRMLKEYYPDLTNNELKLCTLLKLNMNLKEAAGIMGISPESVKKARHRLRKKFNLDREDNLIDHIISLEKHSPLPLLPAQVA